VEIRPLSNEYKDQVKKLVLSVYEDTPEAFFYAQKPSEDELEALLQKKIEENGRGIIDIVALEDGKVIGECEVVKYGKEGVIGILVEKNHREKGVGTALLKTALTKARSMGVDRAVAKVNDKNNAARLFFEKLGFRKAGSGMFELRI